MDKKKKKTAPAEEADAAGEPEEVSGETPQEESAETAAPAAPVTEAETEAEAAAGSAAEAAEDRLAKAKAEAEDYKRKWYNVSAEYENYRKRTAKLSVQRYLEGRADVVSGLFPIADNLERAMQSCADEGTKKGIEMVLKTFSKLLETEKITVIDPKGEPFDADRHEAIMAVDALEGEESGTVREVCLKGYAQGDKVLRYAQVVVVK